MARRRSGGFGKTIDFKEWASLGGLSTEVASDTTALAGGLSFLAPGTILRIVGGGGLFRFDADKQIDDSLTITLGIGIVSTDAFTAGAASMPDPDDEVAYPWLWWTSFTLDSQVAAASDDAGGSLYRVPPIDSKSMRKFKPSQTLTTIIQTTGAAGAPQTIIELDNARVLIGT